MEEAKTEGLIVEKKLKQWRSVFFISFVLYFLSNCVLYFYLASELSLTSSAGMLLVKTLPLLPFIPSLIKPNYKTAVAFCCLLLFYFTFTAFALFHEGARAYMALVESVLLLSLFWSAFKLGKLN
jgi:uncharacterized membrane protein